MDKPPFSKSDIQLSEILAGLTDSVERGIDKVSRRQAMKGLYFGGLGLVAYSALKPSVTQNLSLASYRTAADIDESIPSLDELRLLANYEHSQLGDDEKLVDFDDMEAAEALEYDDSESEVQRFHSLLRRPTQPEEFTRLESKETASPLESEDNHVGALTSTKQLGAAPIEQVVSGQDLIEVDLPEALSPVLPTPDVKPETIAKLVLPPVPKVKPEAPVEPILPRIKPKLKFTVAVPKTAPSGKKPENKIFTASAPKLHIPSAGTRRLSVHAVNLNERETVTFAKNGRYDERGLRELNYIFRDRHTGSVRKMDPHLYDSLFELVSRAGDGQTEIKLISGYRTKKTNARLRRRSKGVAKNSYHITGQAVDFYLSNRSLKELHRNAVILDLGGVGYYPGANFVHMDTGPNRTWPRKYKYLVKRYRGYA
jgi:uncharacterized protein YcbK (DUF882 family)